MVDCNAHRGMEPSDSTQETKDGPQMVVFVTMVRLRIATTSKGMVMWRSMTGWRPFRLPFCTDSIPSLMLLLPLS